MNAITKKLLSFVIVLAMVLSMSPVITLPAEAAIPEDAQTKLTTVKNWHDTVGKTFDTIAVEGVVTATCPICSVGTDGNIDTSKTFTWNGAASVTSAPAVGSHTYITADYTGSAANYIAASTSGKNCIYLNSKDVSSTGNGRWRLRGNVNVIAYDSTVTRANLSSTTVFLDATGGTANVYGGTFINNDASTPLVRKSSTGTLNLYSGIYQDANNNAVLLKNDSTGTINIYGSASNPATITGKVTVAGAGSLNMGNVNITGDVTVAAGASIALSGSTTITAGTAGGLVLADGVTANITGLEGGSIAVTGAEGATIATGGDATKAGYFTPPAGLYVVADGTNLVLSSTPSSGGEGGGEEPAPTLPDGFDNVHYENNIAAWLTENASKFTSGDVETDYCPVCGATEVTWTPRSGTNACYSTTVAEAQHYYVASNVTRNTFDAVGATQEYPVCVYLNNKTYSTTGTFQVQNTLNIFDDPNVNGGKVLGADGTEKAGNYVKMPLFRLLGAAPSLNLYYGEYEGAQPFVTDLNVNGTAVIGSEVDAAKAYLYKGTFKNTGAGAVIEVEAGEVTMNGGSLQGGNGYIGEDYTMGGNVYMTGGTFNLEAGSITNGKANRGADVYVSGATLNVSGGTITGGTLENVDNNYTGSVYVASATLNMSGGTITGKVNSTCSALAVSGSTAVVKLSGEAKVLSEAGNAARFFFGSNLQIDKGWSGTAYIMYGKSAGWDLGAKLETYNDGKDRVVNAKWGTITADGNFTAPTESDTAFPNGKLYQGTGNGAKIYGLADGTLQVAGGKNVTDNVSYPTAQDAVDAADATDVLWLGQDVALANGKEITVDMGGSNNVTISGSGTVNGFDSDNDGYDGNGGTLTVAEADVENITVTSQYKHNGNRYFALADLIDENTYTFRRFKIELSAVTLRPGTTKNEMGMYYKADITCDKTLGDRVTAYGVVLSLDDMPDENFLYERGNQITVNEGQLTFPTDSNTVRVTSGLLRGIWTEGDQYKDRNSAYSEEIVYANAYLQIDDEVFVMSDTDNGGTEKTEGVAYSGVAWSLLDLLKGINQNLVADEAHYADNKKDALGLFYDAWVGFVDIWSDLAAIAACGSNNG